MLISPGHPSDTGNAIAAGGEPRGTHLSRDGDVTLGDDGGEDDDGRIRPARAAITAGERRSGPTPLRSSRVKLAPDHVVRLAAVEAQVEAWRDGLAVGAAGLVNALAQHLAPKACWRACARLGAHQPETT